MSTPSSSSSQYGTPGGVLHGGVTPPSAGSSARRSVARTGGSPTEPNALALEINRLRSDLRAKSAEGNELVIEVRTLKKLIAAKDEAIEAAEVARGAAEERVLQQQVDVAALRKSAAKWELQRKRLQAEADAANSEADRLNALMLSSSGSNSKVVNSSMEDTVRLHNQLAEARKEIKRLRDDSKGTSNVIAAKDLALEQAAGEAAAARAALEERLADQNVIADLRRQLEEAHQAMGREARLGQLATAEVDQLRQELQAKSEEVGSMRGCLEGALQDAAGAQGKVAAADGRAQEADARAREAVDAVQRAKRAEVERMPAGGVVTKLAHLEEVRHHQAQVEALRQQLAAAEVEARQARAQRQRLLPAVDEAAAALTDAADLAPGTSAAVITALRAEVAELSAAVDAKGAESAALGHARRSAVARASRERVAAHRLKTRLAELLGGLDYTLEFKEPPPGEEEVAVAEAEAAAEAERVAAEDVPAAAAARDAALAEAAGARALAAQAHREAADERNAALAEAGAATALAAQAQREASDERNAALAEAAAATALAAQVQQEATAERDVALAEAAAATALAVKAKQDADVVATRAMEDAKVASSAQLQAAQSQLAEKVEEVAALRAELDEAAKRVQQAQGAAQQAHHAVTEASAKAAALHEELQATRAAEAAAAVVAKEEAAFKDQLVQAARAEALAAATAAVVAAASAKEQADSKDREISALRNELAAAEGHVLCAASDSAAIAALTTQLAEKAQELASVREQLREVQNSSASVAGRASVTGPAAAAAAVMASVRPQLADSDQQASALRSELQAAGLEAKAAAASAAAEIAALKEDIAGKVEEMAALQQHWEEQAAGAEETHTERMAALQRQVTAAEAEAVALRQHMHEVGPEADTASGVLQSEEQMSQQHSSSARPGSPTSLPTIAEGAGQQPPSTPPGEIAIPGAQAAEPVSRAMGPTQLTSASSLGSGARHLQDLVMAKVDVAELKQRVDELESELAAARAAGYDAVARSVDEDKDDGGSSGSDNGSEADAMPRPKFVFEDAGEGAGLTSAALAGVLDRLLAQREDAKGGAAAADAALYDNAVAMLQAELARLAMELAESSNAAARLRSEVGSLQTAQLSAEATAELLEQHNRLSMRMVSMQAQLDRYHGREGEYVRWEESMLAEIATLKVQLRRKKRGFVRSATKARRKVMDFFTPSKAPRRLADSSDALASPQR